MAGARPPRSRRTSVRDLAVALIAALERRPYAVLCGTLGVGYVLAAGLSPSLIALTARTASGALVDRLLEAVIRPADRSHPGDEA